MANIRKRGEAYQIRVSAGYDVTGKQIIKTRTWTPDTGMTTKQIEKELTKQAVNFEKEVQTGQFLDGSITLSDFINKWLINYAEKQLKEKTLKGYKDLMPNIIKSLGHIRLAKLQPHHLMEFYNNLGESGIRQDTKYKPSKDLKAHIQEAGYTQKSLAAAAGVGLRTIQGACKGENVRKDKAASITAALGIKNLFEPVNADKKLSDSTIAKYHRVLSSILTTAVQWQVIPSNPCGRVKPPHVEYKEAPVLDEKEVQRLIECLNSEPLKYKVAIMLILYTGLRRGELCALNWTDIDLKNGVISITKNLLYTPNRGVYEDTTKTKQSQRAVNIPPDMVSLLKEYKRAQLETAFELGDQWQFSGKAFTNDTGGAMFPDTLSRWYKGFIKRHDLPDSHIHTLRHVSATMLIAGGVDIATVSKRLGHANKTTTLNIYTHAIQSADARAAETLQNMLNPSRKYNA